MKVLLIDTVDPLLKEGIQNMGFELHEDYQSSKSEIEDRLSEFDGIVIRSRFPVDASFIARGSRLKFIARVGAGMENIDIPFAESRNIPLIKAPEGNRDAVGEHAVGMLLMLFNNLKRADTQVRQGLWKREANRGLEIHGKTIGIIGYGYMGSAFAEKLQGFGCRVIAYDKYKSGFGNELVKEVSLQELQAQSDIVSLHIPQTPETRGMVNAGFIEAMGKPFFLVNTARGKSVETAALVDGLKTGKVLGACLDVLEYEKASFENMFSGGLSPAVASTERDRSGEIRRVGVENPDDPTNATTSQLPSAFQYLINAENVILTPHIAGWSQESNKKMAQVILDKIKALKLV